MPNFAAVLTGPSVSEHDAATVSRHFAATAQSAPIWLAAGRACEWHLKGDGEIIWDALATLRSEITDAPLDINLVPRDEDRRKRLLIADMDSTIIEQECIDEIADFAGHGAQVAAITERAMRGELDFDAALKTRVGLLKGLTIATLEQVISERITLTPGAKTTVATMAANGAFCALVSGGFTFFTSRISQRIGFHENRANTLETDNGRLTGNVVPPILGQQAKLDALREFTHTHQIPMSATMAVGDGANDLAMIKASGLGVAFHAKPVVAQEAKAQIRHGDLTDLLYLQGYHRDDFVC